MFRCLLLLAVIAALACTAPARAQTPPSGFDMAKSLVGRMVRVTGRQAPGAVGQAGYGLVTGEEANSRGETVLLVVVPYNVVRDPERPGAVFQPPGIVFAGEPLRHYAGEVLAENLPPDRGNLALVSVRKPESFRTVPAMMADAGTVLPGVPVWQAGLAADFAAATAAGRLAYQDQVGWLLFDGIDNTAAAIGAAVVGDHGVIGLAMGPAPQDPVTTRVIPLPFVAMRVRAWGHAWDISAAGSAGARGMTAGPTRYTPTRQGDGMALAPIRVVPLLDAEATARSSWVPKGAKVSPWFSRAASLFGSPRREAAMVGVMPAGRYLPEDLWRDGAYDIAQKLDGGAWLHIGTSGQDLGFVSGADIVEVWPALREGGSAGKVVREWTGAGGKPAVLRDAGTSFEIEVGVECALPRCQSAILFTPPPPEAGAVVPTFQMAPLRGVWRKGEMVPLRAMVPRQAIESRGAVLLACAGNQDECPRVTVYPPPAG